MRNIFAFHLLIFAIVIFKNSLGHFGVFVMRYSYLSSLYLNPSHTYNNTRRRTRWEFSCVFFAFLSSILPAECLCLQPHTPNRLTEHRYMRSRVCVYFYLLPVYTHRKILRKLYSLGYMGGLDETDRQQRQRV